MNTQINHLSFVTANKKCFDVMVSLAKCWKAQCQRYTDTLYIHGLTARQEKILYKIEYGFNNPTSIQTLFN